MARMNDRFVIAYRQGSFKTETKILVDRTTGVNYLYHQSGYSGGMTPLLDREGKPVITSLQSLED